MTAMKAATLLLIAAVGFAGVAHGEQPNDVLDGSARRDILNWGQQQQQQPRNNNANRVKVVNPTFQNAQTGKGGNGGDGGISLLDGNSIAIAIIPIGGGAQSGSTNGNYANGGNGGNSGAASNTNQNNVGVLGVAGRKLLNWGQTSSQPQPSRNTNRIKVIDLTGQSATTGNGGNGGDGGLSAADANSIAVALAPFLGGAKSGSTGGNFANGGNGGNSGDATNKNSNNVGVGSFAGGRKLQNWGETSSQPQPSRNTNRIKVIDLTRQSATTGNGGNGGDGGVSAADANSIAVALLPFLGGAKSGSTGGNFANGGNGGNSGSASNTNQNNVGVGSFAGGRKLLNWGQTSSQPQQGRNTNRVKVVNLTGQSATTGKGGNGGDGGISLLDGNSIAIALIPLGGGAQSGSTNGNYANGGSGGNSGDASNTNKNNVGIIGGGK